MRGSYLLRTLDRVIGIPIVFLLGLLKSDRSLENSGPPLEPKRIAVLLSAAIGDSVLFLSVVTDIRRHFPNASVTVFVGPSNREFVQAYYDVKVIPLWILNPIHSVYTILKSGCHDVWIDTGQWQRISSVYSFFARAKWKIGFRTLGQGRHFVFDTVVSHLSKVHELDNFRSLVRPLGITSFSNPVLPKSRSSEVGKVVIHAFAGGSKPYLKEWPEVYWIELINGLLQLGKHIVLTGVSSDQVRAGRIAQRTTKPYAVQVLAGKLKLTETVDELSSAETVVSVNTGVMHLAAALGVRTIGIHGPTSVIRWGPMGQNGIGVQSPRICSPCLNLGFDYGCPRNNCMQDLTVTEVLHYFRD